MLPQPPCSRSETPPAEPDAAVQAMLRAVRVTGIERVPVGRSGGRILAMPAQADRPSPACDVSAMDGYAVRRKDMASGTLPVAGEVMIGREPPVLQPGTALRIFTGGPVPADADAVIPREDLQESPASISFAADLVVKHGQHIRRTGENCPAGAEFAAAGVAITPAVAAALAAFGDGQVAVHAKVRVAVIVTGNEVRRPSAAVTRWELRDSNGPGLEAMFSALRWVEWGGVEYAPDEPRGLTALIEGAFAAGLDALLITGGVSMGDHDYVPAALAQAGGRQIFHRLPIRPGKPVLGAIGPNGEAVVALPGNPVSVMSTARLIAAPVLRHVAGFREAEDTSRMVHVLNPDDRTLRLHWMRPVRLCGSDGAHLVATQGSGDIVNTATSDGFIQCSPGSSGPGPFRFRSWSLM